MDSSLPSQRANMPPASSWTLEGDGKLLEYMESIAKNLENRSNKTMKDMNNMMLSVDVACVNLENAGNKLQRLQQTQFIENRVQDEDVQMSVEPETVDKPPLDDVEATKIVMNDSLKMLEKCYKKISLEQDDDDESDGDDESLRHIYKPINPYDKRNPYIIGTKEWLEKMHIGLENDDDESEEIDDDDVDDESVKDESNERVVPQKPDSSISTTSPEDEEEEDLLPSVNHVHVPNMIATLPELLKANEEHLVLPSEPTKVQLPKTEQNFFRNQPTVVAPSIPTIPQHFTQNFFDDEPPELDNISVGNQSMTRAAPNLFTESDEENENFIKTTSSMTPNKQTINTKVIDEPDKVLQSTTPINTNNRNLSGDKQVTNTSKSFNTSKVSNLFEDSDDDEDYFDIIRKSNNNSSAKSAVAVKVPEKTMSVNLVKEDSPKIKEETPAKPESVMDRMVKSVPPKKVSNLFDDSDDDDDFLSSMKPKSVLTKKEEPKVVPVKEVVKEKEPSKIKENVVAPKKLQKSLFDSDDDDDFPVPLPKFDSKKQEKVEEVKASVVQESKKEKKVEDTKSISVQEAKKTIEVNPKGVFESKKEEKNEEVKVLSVPEPKKPVEVKPKVIRESKKVFEIKSNVDAEPKKEEKVKEVKTTFVQEPKKVVEMKPTLAQEPKNEEKIEDVKSILVQDPKNEKVKSPEVPKQVTFFEDEPPEDDPFAFKTPKDPIVTPIDKPEHEHSEKPFEITSVIIDEPSQAKEIEEKPQNVKPEVVPEVPKPVADRPSTLLPLIDDDSFTSAPSIPEDNLFSPQSDAFFTPNTTTGSSTTPVTPVYRSFIDDLPPEDDYTVPATFDDFDYNQEDNENFEENNAKTATDPFLFNEEPPELTETAKIDEDKVDNSKEIKAESFKNKFKMFEPTKVDPKTEAPKEKKEISKPAPKKLNVNLNINVSALLPGAKRPPPKKSEEEDEVKFEEKSQKTPEADSNISKPVEEKKESEPVIATPAKYTTTEAQESTNLLVSLNKNRVKAPTTRKPSTRKARVQSYHESTVKGESVNVLQTNTEVKGKEPPLSVAEMLRKEKLKDQLSRRSLNFDEIDEFKVPLKKDLKSEVAEKKVEIEPKPLLKETVKVADPKVVEKEATKPVEVKKIEKSVKTAIVEPKKVEKETQPKSKVVQDDPLKIVEPKIVEKVEKIVEKKPLVNVVAPQKVEKPAKIEKKQPEKVVETVKASKLEKSSPNRKPLLFDDDDDDEDDPFSIVSRPKTKVSEPPKPVEPVVKPKEKSKSSVFASDSDDDDLFSTIKPKSAPKMEEKSAVQSKIEQKPTTKVPKLFDDSDEDDLFSGKASNKKGLVTSTVTKSSNISKPDRKTVQPKSIFGSDDDGDDLFSKVNAPKKKSVTKPASDSLFGDDSDDDSLFGAASSKGKTKSSKKIESGTKTGAVKKTTSVVQNDPLADLLK